jgi:hypothetical protein
MPSLLARLLLAAALLSLAAGRADAELIHFSYTWQVFIDAPPPDPRSVTITLSGPQGSEPFSGSAPLIPGVPHEWTPLRRGEIRTSGEPGAEPLTLDAPVHAVLDLTDASSGESGQVSVEGRLRGTVGFDFSGMGLIFPHVINPDGFPLPPPDAPAELRLGDHLYRFQFYAYGVPQANSPHTGEIYASVLVSEAPEPSGMALAATAAGLVACGLFRRRRR